MIKCVNVDCAFTGQLQTISVNYCHVPILGALEKSYKKIRYDCPLYDECPSDLKDQYGNCSAYMNLPTVIHG